MSNCSIKFRHVSKRYDQTVALESVSFDVPEGAIFGLIGPNGAGKSTILKIISGIDRPDIGSVEINSFDVVNAREVAVRSVGCVFERDAMYPALSVAANLKLAALVRNVPVARILDVANDFNIVDILPRPLRLLSLGMKKRVAIARAFLENPKILVLDEPFNGLDPPTVRHLSSMLKGLAMDMGVTILITSHLISELTEVCSHFGAIRSGSMVFSGAVDEIKESQAPQRVIFYVNSSSLALQVIGNLFVGQELSFDAVEYTIKSEATKVADIAEINGRLVEAGVVVSGIVQPMPNVARTLSDFFDPI